MSTLLIGYDLDAPGQDYADLGEAIKAAGSWWHHLDSTWLVKTALSAKGMRDRLMPFLDANDKLLVLDVTRVSWAGAGFQDRAYDWIRACLPG